MPGERVMNDWYSVHRKPCSKTVEYLYVHAQYIHQTETDIVVCICIAVSVCESVLGILEVCTFVLLCIRDV